jgi:hypothetical protein
MKRDYKKNTKVFFSVNEEINTKFEKFCDDNYMNKSKLVEGLMRLVVEKPEILIELKNLK